MTTLYRVGRLDVAYRLFQNDSFPSWGFSIRHGATSIWERWDGWTPEKGFQDPGMNSFAHYSFGAVCEWMFKVIGGIDFTAPGYEQILIHPIPGGRFTWAKTQHDSIRGRIATDWKLEKGNLTLKVEIPANTTATVCVPAESQDAVSEAGKFAGAKFVRMDNGFAVYEAGSGSYEFVSKGVVAGGKRCSRQFHGLHNGVKMGKMGFRKLFRRSLSKIPEKCFFGQKSLTSPGKSVI